MNKHWFSLVFLVAAVNIWGQQKPAPERKILLSVEGSGSKAAIDAIAFIANGHLSAAPDNCGGEDPSFSNFERKYLSVGKSYRLIVDGAISGKAEISGKRLLDVPARIVGWKPTTDDFSALATNAPEFGRREGPAADQVSMEQRARVVRTAKEVFEKHGVEKSVVSKIKLDEIQKAHISKGEVLLLVTASVPLPKDMGPRATLFLAVPENPGLNAELIWYHETKDQSDATDVEGLRLVGHADLDGDGTDEIVTRVVLYENYQYRIFKRVSDRWKILFETKVLGCE